MSSGFPCNLWLLLAFPFLALGLSSKFQENSQHHKDDISLAMSHLDDYFKRGNAEKYKEKMSKVERDFFWPSIQEAHALKPHLNSRKTWPSGSTVHPISITVHLCTPTVIGRDR